MADSTYGPLDRLLHRLALQSGAVAEMSFDLDQQLVRTEPSRIVARRHVFVSGLARAGTTVLMRRFHATGEFHSLTYRDMPFVLAPNLWRRLSGGSRRHVAASERAHGDDVLVDLDSPESLDEVFWRTFAARDYLRPDRLVPHDPDDELVAKYVRYVNAILASQGAVDGRYLCKNNNNILRLGAIRRAFPHALILVPFRDPLHHADSLWRQHRLFSRLQAEDPFTKSYMSWLAHHEFGLDHRRFRFASDAQPGPGRTAEPTSGPAAGPASIDYWLELWLETYAWLEQSTPDSVVFVCYEDLCAGPGHWQALARRAGVAAEAGGTDFFQAPVREIESNPGGDRLDAARQVYARLREAGRSVLG